MGGRDGGEGGGGGKERKSVCWESEKQGLMHIDLDQVQHSQVLVMEEQSVCVSVSSNILDSR